MTPRARKPRVAAPPAAPEAPVEHRAPVDEQPFALAAAEDAGVLPDVDRRAESPAEHQWPVGVLDIKHNLPEVDAVLAAHEPNPAEEVIASPVVRDLSLAHERIQNDRGGFDYFTASGEQL